MEVITVDSEVYQLFKERLDRIEKYIERAANMEWKHFRFHSPPSSGGGETVRSRPSSCPLVNYDSSLKKSIQHYGAVRFVYRDVQRKQPSNGWTSSRIRQSQRT